MNPRYGTQNAPTSILKLLHVSTRIIGFHFWKHILFNPLECFRFFMAANTDFV